jgi:hypothetical protein
MPATLFNNVMHWLERAEKARVHADLLTDLQRLGLVVFRKSEIGFAAPT